MSTEELLTFIELTIEASRFSPNVTSEKQDKWRGIIESLELLREAIRQVERARAA